MDVELQEQFESAAKYMAGLSAKLSPDTLLYFYARYKQAKIGPCDTDKPGFFDFQGKQKWSAWKSLGDMTTETAMQEYIDKLDEIDPDWEGKEITEAQDSSWVSVSCMQNTDEEILDKDKNLVHWIQENNIEKVTKLVQSDKSLISIPFEDLLPLHWAADRGSAEIIQVLLEHGAEINAQDTDGQTALHYACSVGHENVIKVLLENKANVDVQDNDGNTAQDVIENDNLKTLFMKSE